MHGNLALTLHPTAPESFIQRPPAPGKGRKIRGIAWPKAQLARAFGLCWGVLLGGKDK